MVSLDDNVDVLASDVGSAAPSCLMMARWLFSLALTLFDDLVWPFAHGSLVPSRRSFVGIVGLVHVNSSDSASLARELRRLCWARFVLTMVSPNHRII